MPSSAGALRGTTPPVLLPAPRAGEYAIGTPIHRPCTMPDTPKPSDHASDARLRIGDADIHFELRGDPAHQLLLLLHGGLGDITGLEAVAAGLASRFRVLGIDTRGHGRSTRGSAPLRYARIEADVRAVLDHVGTDTFSVLGFSDGGIVGYRLAAAMGARVRALVAVGAQWRLEADDPALAMLGSLTARDWDEMFPAARAHYESINPKPDFDGLVQHAVGLWTDTGPGGYPGERVRDIASPTLLVRGDSDPLFPLAEAAALQAILPGASLFNIPFAGHECHIDAPALFLRVAEEFLLAPRARDSGG